MYINPLECCGVKEIAHLSTCHDPEAAMVQFCLGAQEYGYRFRYAMFSQASSRTYGEEFAAFIEDHQLGTVIATNRHRNPNSGNILKVWVWTISTARLKKWARAHGVPPVV